MTLVVLGSANLDYTVVVDRRPDPGETVLASELTTAVGGKGANQAVAAAREGIRPLFVAAVGPDGDSVLSTLSARGVDVSRVQRSTVPTGIALITVGTDGENTIVVAPGANSTLDAAEIVRSLAPAVLLAQLEIPLEVVVASAPLAGRFVLNLSPFRDIPAPTLALADPLIVNEHEAALLGGVESLSERCRSVVITRGADGALVIDAEGTTELDAPAVTVVDSTGAGDAFAGALAAALALGDDLLGAARRGISAGAAAVQHVGAQR